MSEVPVRVSREEVLRAQRDADAGGKHQRGDYHAWEERLHPGPWYRVRLAPQDLDIAGFDEARAEGYARRQGALPPILVSYGKRRKIPGPFYVVNGNHRGRAAQLRDEIIEAYVTGEDWNRWLTQHMAARARSKLVDLEARFVNAGGEGVYRMNSAGEY